MKIKKLLIIPLTTAFILSGMTTDAWSAPAQTKNIEIVAFNNPETNDVFIPIRSFTSELDGKIEYDKSDKKVKVQLPELPLNKKVSLVAGRLITAPVKTINSLVGKGEELPFMPEVKVDIKDGTVEDKKVKATPFVSGGKTYVPLKPLIKELGGSVTKLKEGNLLIKIPKREPVTVKVKYLPEITIKAGENEWKIYPADELLDEIAVLDNGLLVPKPYSDSANKLIGILAGQLNNQELIAIWQDSIESISKKLAEPNTQEVNLPVSKLLSEYELHYFTNDSGAVNAAVGANYLNETVVKPGEVFSFNDIVGNRTVERGFIPSVSVAGNKIVADIGGGVCRTSTALHQAVLTTGLQVIERHSHTLPVSYAVSGMDAAVAWGGWDYQFKNNTNFPILINTEASDNGLCIKIWQKLL